MKTIKIMKNHGRAHQLQRGERDGRHDAADRHAPGRSGGGRADAPADGRASPRNPVHFHRKRDEVTKNHCQTF